LVDVPLETRF